MAGNWVVQLDDAQSKAYEAGELKYIIFFFKQKTAYEIKECDWSSDVCSSDLSIIPT